MKISEQLYQSIAAYIDAHYAQTVICATVESVRHPDASCYEKASFQVAAPCAPVMAPKRLSLQQRLEQVDAGFSETLLKLIDKTGKKDSAIYKRAGLTKQHFSKIRNDPDYRPTKPTAIALALALELNMDETKDLIGRAGYTLSNSSKFDLIICFFIENRNYDLTQINIALYEFDQPIL